MRKILALTLACATLAGCTAGTNQPSPLVTLGVGDAFTLGQAAAAAYLAKSPANAAKVQALLSASQAAFVAWTKAAPGSTAEEIALQSAVAALTSYLMQSGAAV